MVRQKYDLQQLFPLSYKITSCYFISTSGLLLIVFFSSFKTFKHLLPMIMLRYIYYYIIKLFK